MSDEPRTPLGALGIIGRTEVRLTPTLRHLEIFTVGGLLSIFWHGDPTADDVLLTCGGAIGGTLGTGGLYHQLGERLAPLGIATLRVGYRAPNDLDRCTHDLVAAAELANRSGAERFCVLGHSFGGAIAVRTGMALQPLTAGVVTLATQSAGCEEAHLLGDTPLLMFHGDRDEILPVFASEAVHHLAGGKGELVILPGAGHVLAEVKDELADRIAAWVPARMADHHGALER